MTAVGSLAWAFRRVVIRLAVLLSVMLLKKKSNRSTPLVILDALFFSITIFLSAPVVQGFCRSAEITVVFGDVLCGESSEVPAPLQFKRARVEDPAGIEIVKK